MADFAELRQALADARGAAAAAEDAAAAARERLARVETALRTLARVRGGEDPAVLRRQEALEAERKKAQASLEGAHAAKERTAKAALDATRAFAPFTDPRKELGRLDDRIPFLMLPVRLETRFGPLTAEGPGARRELWVRIYPDDCSIDTFEPTLTAGEVSSARAYWAAVWAVGGAEPSERAAWRALVASHGSGRAEWIVGQYRPQGSKPAKTAETDVILAVPAVDGALAPAEQTALATFWPALWRAAGDRLAEQAARAALATAVGAERAIVLEQEFAPVNRAEEPIPPLGRDEVGVSVAFVVFPPDEDVPTKRTGWSRAPKATLLPDRFVFIGRTAGQEPVVAMGAPVPSPLVTGPDPYAPPAEQLRPQDGDLFVPEAMRWMVDFAEAVRVGMGIRVPLTGAQATAGFDRVLVVGVRLATDALTAKADLEALLEHHRLGRSGMSLVPQGTPTNNLDSGPSGFSRVDDADRSFDALFQGGAGYPAENDPLDKRDGQWLTEFLGLAPTSFQKVQHSGGRDQGDARAMNTALWPATLGYWMETMMQPVFAAAAVDATREFFTGYVSARGIVPAIRIGRQPYGILPTTAFSRLGWLAPERVRHAAVPPGRSVFLRQLLEVLRRMDADWTTLAAGVSAVGQGTDPHKTLLDVIGLHPGSAELSNRYAESVTHLYNELLFLDFASFLGEIVGAPLRTGAMQLLSRLGYAGTTTPEILSRIFRGRHEQLKGPVVEDGKISEANALKPATTDGRNYLRWLADAARTSLDALYAQQGFVDDAPPRALLYLMLRHALQLGYHDGSVRAHVAAGLLTVEAARAARRDATFLHVQDASQSESRYALLLKTAPEITGSATKRISDYMAAKLGVLEFTRPLAQQLDALDRLAEATTARLERAFLEHVDLCAYRLDAWLQGFVHLQLEFMREPGGREGARPGIHLGAYAWVEELRPDPAALVPMRLPPDLAEVFQRPGDPPLQRDPQNEGFVHAPSLNHAVTAAVLRNGYLSNASPTNRKTMAVNLTSQRVRVAMAMLEGIRGGQSLGALLGYQMERGLHDRHGFAEVDQFIYDLRKSFPLSADRMASTRTADDVPIEAIEARNVMDGLALAQHVQATGNAHYPFGKALPPATPAQAAAIDAEVQRLLDAQDAVADLALAEGVHQALLGNPERAAGTADAFGRGSLPPAPEVIRTPASGIGLTHRVGLQLKAGADPAASPIPGVDMTPRAQAEPALNRWLAGRLPPQDEVGCMVSFQAAASGAPATRQVTLLDLALQPIDLVLLTPGDGVQAMAELDDRIVAFANEHFGPRPDMPIQIRYMESSTAPLTLFETLPLLRALRRLVTLSRPLAASDLALMNEAAQAHDAGVFVDRQRLVLARDALVTSRDALAALLATISALLADLPARRADIVSAADAWAHDLSAALAGAALAGVNQAGWGFAQDFRLRTFQAVLDKTRAQASRWNERLVEFDALVGQYDALPAGTPDEERFGLLQQAERRVATVLTTPRPATPAALRALLPARRAAFVARRDQLDAVQSTARTSVSLLLADVNALLPLTDFDLQDLSLAEEEDQAVRFAEDAVRVCQVVVAELQRRVDAAAGRITAHDDSADPPVRAKALMDAGKALFGEGFAVIPEFDLAPGQGDELATALAASASGELFQYLTETVKADFPVDTWLYGVARVRDKLRTYEQVLHLSAAFGRSEPELTALQLPALPGDRWLGLEIPPDLPLSVDRLLYTAHFAAPFDSHARQCGLLVDEWSESIPGADVTTGIAFHHDRPNNEAPQAMLLVTPTDFREGWLWADLVDALDETLDRAKRRAVEPVHLDATAYAQLLPATVMATTVNQLTISAVLAVNNGLLAVPVPSATGPGG
jgi:hypothetical protein